MKSQALADTAFVSNHSTQLIVRTPENNAYEVRTLAGEYVRTLLHTRYGLVDVDNRAERFLLRTGVGFAAADSSGALRPLAPGQRLAQRSVRRFRNPDSDGEQPGAANTSTVF